MRPVSALLRGGPRELKLRYLSFGGGQGYVDPDFWLSDDRHSLFSSSASTGKHESIGTSFEDYVSHAYKANGVVFTVIMVRQFALSEARFQFQRLENGRPAELHDDPKLSILHRPAPNQTTGELIARMEQDASLAGNFYAVPVNGRLRRLRPDWVTIVSGSNEDPEMSPFDVNAEVLGYIYHPKLRNGVKRPDPVFYTPRSIVHYSPNPDPMAQWRGMSWLTPILAEIDGDNAAMAHKIKMFQNGAFSNLALTYPAEMDVDTFQEYVALFKDNHKGTENAWRTLHMGSGVDPKVLSMNLKDLDFKSIQGHGESRIAAAGGVGAIFARLPESLGGAGLMQGNFSSAMRQCADTTVRPTWRMMSASLESIVPPPAGERLWYDDRDIEFLKADAKDAAEIEQIKAITIRQLVDGGYDPMSVIAAVEAQNMHLVQHTGKLSVQLQSVDGSTTAEDQATTRAIAEIVQKVYLGVTNGVLTAEEARALLNRAGAGLTGAAPTPS